MSGPVRASVCVALVGHVDHGKSTLAGRLLADAGSLTLGRLEALGAEAARSGRPLEYAHLLDSLRDERAQGITIDFARAELRGATRDYRLVDAPGHADFLRGMASGAARADAALLVVDVREGVRESTRAHARLLSMLGVAQVAIAVNKMDAVDFRQDAFAAAAREALAALDRVGLRASAVVPIAAALGDNVVARSAATPWYRGPTVLDALDAFDAPRAPREAPLRLWVQDVYHFPERERGRRVIAVLVETGELRPGDALVFHPSGRRGTVAALETFPPRPLAAAGAGECAAFALEEELYVRRGEAASRAGEPPLARARRLRAAVFWLGRRPLDPDREYGIKLGTGRARARLEGPPSPLDGGSASGNGAELASGGAAQCRIRLDAELACLPAAEDPAFGRFVLLDGHEAVGGGLVLETLAAAGERPRPGGALVVIACADAARARRIADEAARLLRVEERPARVLPDADPERRAEDARLLCGAGAVAFAAVSRWTRDCARLLLAAAPLGSAASARAGAPGADEAPCDVELADAGDDECARAAAALARRLCRGSS